MDEKKSGERVLSCPLKYLLEDDSGDKLSEGKAEADLSEEALLIKAKFGEALYFRLRDVDDITKGDYSWILTLCSGEKLTLFHLGYKYDAFGETLIKLYNELNINDLLMKETVRLSGLTAECTVTNEKGDLVFQGKGEPRLYDTALVLLPENGEPLRFPYSFINRVEDNDYTLTMTTDFGETLEFSRMGRHFEPFCESFSGVMNDLFLKVQNILTELVPEAGPAVVRKAAKLIWEGKAVRRADLDTVSPGLWASLEKKLESLGIRHEYDFLSSMAQQEKMCIGLKRGLVGDLTGEYVWFLIPVYSLDSKLPGNTLAMEAAAENGGGRATYFFRITGRADYSGFSNIDELHDCVDKLIARINRCMLDINFRREPIYLSDDQINEPKYLKYRYAIRKIPGLQELRRLFIGRVFHRSPEQWEQDVMELLRFNVSASSDEMLWSKK